MSAALKDSWNAFVALISLVTWPIRWVYKRIKFDSIGKEEDNE